MSVRKFFSSTRGISSSMATHSRVQVSCSNFPGQGPPPRHVTRKQLICINLRTAPRGGFLIGRRHRRVDDVRASSTLVWCHSCGFGLSLSRSAQDLYKYRSTYIDLGSADSLSHFHSQDGAIVNLAPTVVRLRLLPLTAIFGTKRAAVKNLLHFIIVIAVRLYFGCYGKSKLDRSGWSFS